MPTDTIREYFVGEFRGDFPDVPIADGVNMDELRETDADPFFVTLPVIPEIGAISKNGLLYDEALVRSIEEQINRKRPGGIFGHLRDDQRDTAFPIPEGMWVGAQRIGQALWAKAYLPPGAARDHMRRLKALGGQIATSIYGKGKFEAVREGVRRLKDFSLESLDFAPPERAALGAGATPFVTSEFEQGDEPAEELHGMTKDELIAELQAGDIPTILRNQIVQEYQLAAGKGDRAAEMTQQLTDANTMIAELQKAVDAARVREFDNALDAQIATLVNWQVKGEPAQAKVDAFRRTLRSRIVAELGAEKKVESIAEVIAEVWKDLQPLAETLRDALAGPPAIVGGHVRNSVKFEDTPETRAAARAQYGF